MTTNHQETRMGSTDDVAFLDTPSVIARLRAIRQAQKLSVRAVSDATGYDYNTCKNIDLGKRQELPYSYLIAMCRALGVDPRELITVGTLEFCVTCSSSPPPGFTCDECGTSTPRTASA